MIEFECDSALLDQQVAQTTHSANDFGEAHPIT
jgi:hypothetical protein